LLYDENPPDLTVGEDDILFLDLGPVFEEWEADFGRTFVLGSDPVKLKLRDDIGKAFIEGKEYFKTHPEITSVELYRHAQKNWLATPAGNMGGPSLDT
jgi:Xaa-Pro dipeptidase